nr:zinc finger, CCHC-type [Tanacetum cinerariifolium]
MIWRKLKVYNYNIMKNKKTLTGMLLLSKFKKKQLDNIKKYQSLKRKPVSKAQAKKNMMIYLKNMDVYKMEHFRGMTYDKVRPIFEMEYNKVQTLFKPDKDVEEPQKKRVAEETLLQESFKKLKAVEVSVSEFKVEALQAKYPLIDWDIHFKGSRSYWKMIRVGRITKAYQIFEDMLKGFDREDLDALHDTFMLTEKNYPLSNGVMTLMLSAKLQVEEDSDMARDLVMKIFMKANKPKRRSTNGGTSNLASKKANFSRSSFWNVESSSTSTTPTVEKIDKIERLIIDSKVTLVDDGGKPLKKVDTLGDHDSEDEVESVDNEMVGFLASKKVGYGTNSLLEQWKETYENADYDYDPYDDDMYEGQEIPDNIRSVTEHPDSESGKREFKSLIKFSEFTLHMKHITSNFAKLDKFIAVDFRRWQKKMHFLLSGMSVVYVTTTIFEDGKNVTMEQIRRRNKMLNLPKSYEIPWKPNIWMRMHQKDFKNTLKHKNEELNLIELGSHLHIEEFLRVQDSDKPKRNNVVGPSTFNMVEHNNSMRHGEHSKAFRFYVIESNESISVNSIIKSIDAIFVENRFSSVPRPSMRSLINETEYIGSSVEQVMVSDQYFYCFNVEDDPKTFVKEMKSQDVSFQKEAINDEMDSVMGNNT